MKPRTLIQQPLGESRQHKPQYCGEPQQPAEYGARPFRHCSLLVSPKSRSAAKNCSLIVPGPVGRDGPVPWRASHAEQRLMCPPARMIGLPNFGRGSRAATVLSIQASKHLRQFFPRNGAGVAAGTSSAATSTCTMEGKSRQQQCVDSFYLETCLLFILKYMWVCQTIFFSCHRYFKRAQNMEHRHSHHESS